MPIRIEPFTEKRSGFTVMGHRIFVDPEPTPAPPQPERDVPNLDCWHCPPQPEPEAKAEPDYTCPECGEDTLEPGSRCKHGVWNALAAANARIAELVRERDEARVDAYEQGRCNGEAAGYAKGVAAAKEACAKRFLAEAYAHSDSGNPIWFTLSQMSARLVRETEVPDA